jgi:hypothetical protein
VAATAALPDGRILIVGGSDGARALATAEIYDPRAGRFQPAGSMSTVREKLGAVALGDGRVLVVGGATDGTWSLRTMLASTEIYDPGRNRFSQGPAMTAARFKFGEGQILRLASGRVLVTGGDERAEVFDPATDRFELASGTLGLARHYGTANILPDGDVLIAGGYGNDAHHSRSAVLYHPEG